MAVIALTNKTQALGINYTHTTANSGDWTSVPNSTYFYNLATNTVHYKTSTGIIKSLFENPYLVYTALVSQTGVSDPTAIVLTNTLGGTVVWTRVIDGNFRATLTGAFPSEDKVYVSVTPKLQFEGDEVYFSIYWSNTDSIKMDIYDSTLNVIDGFYKISVEIRVYP